MPRPSFRLAPLVALPFANACAGTAPSHRTDLDLPSPLARSVADTAVERYGELAIDTLGELVRFDTFARPGTPNAEHASFRKMTAYLGRVAEDFGLEFEDHGAVVVVGLGSASERLGIVTHGDVQPADAGKWARDPFELDLESEPGRLVGRGVEDDKGPIACALLAMRAIREAGVPLERRIELIVSYTEESDWEPFQAFLAENAPPALNVAIDAEYPVVVAEKGWCLVTVELPMDCAATIAGTPWLASFSGGFFASQVPEDAVAVVRDATAAVERHLRDAAERDEEASFAFERAGDELTVRAKGRAAHSSKPEQGVNAITHLAALLGAHDWPASAPAQLVKLTNDLVGTGYYAERFGDLAYEDPFMGPLTLSFSTVQEEEDALVAQINLRRPVGRSTEDVQASVARTLDAWSVANPECPLEHSATIGTPHPPVDAPHVDVLLATYRHYTGEQDAEPISIGGGTHGRLVPNGVNFGASMPGEPYTGHSEHEYMSREQFLLNLRMYTSLLVDLATR